VSCRVVGRRLKRKKEERENENEMKVGYRYKGREDSGGCCYINAILSFL